MRVLIIGSGGREHALAWKIKQSSILTKLYVIPGNAGIATIAECIDIPLTDFKQISNFIGENKIELVIIGPEKPLADGLVDFLYETHPTLKVFGPNKYCAKLESSKAFTKEIGMKLGIPQAQYKIFTTYQTAIKYISTLDFPIVIKADGLAQGKGTFIVENLSEAKSVVEDLLVHKKLQSAGEKIVVESFLDGKEVSYILLTDSEGIINLPPIRDFKKLHKNGPNTGGMGAIAPVLDFDSDDELYTIKKIILPTLSFLKARKHTYIGALYAGLIKVSYGIKLLEFNVRFGDPETQCVMPLIKNDFLEVIIKCTEKKIKEAEIQFYNKFSCCICLVSGGYPNQYQTGYEIEGLEKLENLPNIIVFHAGTKKEGNKFITNGGRVLNIVGLGSTPDEAKNNAYNAISYIKFENMFYRKDIDWKT